MDPVLAISLTVLSILGSVLLLILLIFIGYVFVTTMLENAYKRGVSDGLGLADTGRVPEDAAKAGEQPVQELPR